MVRDGILRALGYVVVLGIVVMKTTLEDRKGLSVCDNKYQSGSPSGETKGNRAIHFEF